MSEQPVGVRWSVSRRLEFIDFRLLWEGRVNRSDLAERFGISLQQASGDLKAYEDAAPANFAYDKNLKAYVRAPGYAPKFVGEFSDRQLLQLMALNSGWIRKEDTYFDKMPPLAVSAITRKRTTYRQLMWVLDAIRNAHEIRLDYQSISGPSEAPRRIAPHAIAYARGRWHARAWNREHNEFRDYNLNRFGAVEVVGSSPVDPALDYEWARQVNVVVAPNPKLSPEVQQAVAMEYEMEDGVRHLPTRLSLVFYLIDEFNLDVPEGVLAPQKQQLVLLNRSEIDAARIAAKADTKAALERASLNGAG